MLTSRIAVLALERQPPRIPAETAFLRLGQSLERALKTPRGSLRTQRDHGCKMSLEVIYVVRHGVRRLSSLKLSLSLDPWTLDLQLLFEQGLGAMCSVQPSHRPLPVLQYHVADQRGCNTVSHIMECGSNDREVQPGHPLTNWHSQRPSTYIAWDRPVARISGPSHQDRTTC